MKTAEDEAFEDIERRQSGGFKAKQAMAADKLQEPVMEREALKLAKDVLLRLINLTNHDNSIYEAVDKCEAALAQPPLPVQQAQEPMAWQWLGSAHFRKKLPKNADKTAWNPLYTTPPKRPLVGLTDEERSQLVSLHHGWNEYGQAIEQRLKEKNT